MKIKYIVLSITAVALLAAGCGKKQVNNKSAGNVEKESKQVMVKDGSMEKDKTMMDESHILGLVNKDGKIYTVWEDNVLALLEEDITLKNGTKVTKDGKITSATGAVIALKNGEELTALGSIMMIDMSKMKVMMEGEMMKDKNMVDNKSDVAMAKHGTYEDYSPEKVAQHQKENHKVVLFFHAPWCPFCKAADTAYQANINQIPAGVVVLKTDYDSNTELKKKYGVTYQHTFVQIDAQGNMVTKWNGGDIDNLKKYLK